MLAPPIVALAFMPFGGRTIGRLGVDRALAVGLVLLAVSAGAMATWGASTPLWFVVATLFAVGGGIAVTLVASATQALSQFAPTEAGIGSALFNSLRQLGAGFGVAVPAVAFELVASGGRTPEAVLDGSSSAFGLRFVILAVAVLLVVKRPVTR
jgi:predicted MFS family arabinose efflux permease